MEYSDSHAQYLPPCIQLKFQKYILHWQEVFGRLVLSVCLSVFSTRLIYVKSFLMCLENSKI